MREIHGRRLEFVGVGCADGDQSGRAQVAVAGGLVGLLLECVVELGTLLSVLDLTNPLTLGGVGDVLGLLLADVAGGLVGAPGSASRNRAIGNVSRTD